MSLFIKTSFDNGSIGKAISRPNTTRPRTPARTRPRISRVKLFINDGIHFSSTSTRTSTKPSAVNKCSNFRASLEGGCPHEPPATRLGTGLKFWLFIGLLTFIVNSTHAQNFTGLWAGNAVIDKVNRSSSGTNVTWNIADMEPTPTELIMRVLVHVDGDGNARLLQRALVGTTPPPTTNDVETFVLMSDESLIDTLGVSPESVKRISTAAFPLMDPILCPGDFGTSNGITAQVIVPHNDPTNPFVHRYHPDHNNLSENFSTALPAGIESYTITRDIEIHFAESDDSPTFQQRVLKGTYQEALSGLHKETLLMAGSIQLEKVMSLDTLEE